MRNVLFAMIAFFGLASLALAAPMNAAMNTNGAINSAVAAAADSAALELSGVILPE